MFPDLKLHRIVMDVRGALTIYIGSYQLHPIRLHTFMFDPLILKIVLKNSFSHKHSNDLIST